MTDEPTVLVLVPDLMVGVRIEDAAKSLGARVATAEQADEPTVEIARLRPQLIVVDLAAPGLDIESLRAEADAAGARVIGFYPHVDVDLRRAAKMAGIERVYARSRFLREMAMILRDSLNH